jgi:uncharacterized protein
VPEVGSRETLTALTGADRVVSSLRLYPEARAAVVREARIHRLPGSRSARARTLLERFWRDVDRIAPTEALVHRAGDLAESQRLRGYDAVHLASLEQLSMEDPVLLSADADLLGAAQSLGFAIVSLTD